MRAPTSPPSICVLEWNVLGHHSAYLRFYTRALLELGCRVTVLCPEPQALAVWWAGEGGVSSEVRARGLCLPMPPRNYSLRGKRWRQAWRRWLHRRAVIRTVAQAEARQGRGIDAVFFSCLYEREASMASMFARALARPWGGLYMQAESYHAGADRMRDLWRVPRLAGLLTLDEEMAPAIERDVGAPVLVAPDLVDTSRRSETGETHARVDAFCAGRPLVGLLGHLQPSKGVLTLAQAAVRPELEGIAFLLAGTIAWDKFSRSEVEFLRRVLDARNRILLLEGNISDETGYNELVARCDLLFAAYHDFPHSSNTLGKAAAFAKPVVVSDGHLMARRVRAYRLGEVVPQRDAAAVAEAILRLIGRESDAGRGDPERLREAYLRTHSEKALRDVLARWLTGPVPGR